MPATTRPRGPRLLFVLALTAALGAAGAGCTVRRAHPDGGAAAGDGGAGGTTTAARALAELRVAAPGTMAGYSRERFRHWKRVGRGCDVRDSVLRRDGLSVRADGCNVTSGRWLSTYDRRTVTRIDEVDVDHVVPLANAWRSGAAAWTDGQREAFANDLTRPQLIAVSAAANRSKGDRDPAEWTPPSRQAWCTYAVSWVAVKRHWKLTVTGAERSALSRLLATC
ncbi:hypothetical protein GCM10010124_40830 [Pilimelia terevasa]|uniref:GmrSD restriction endonucleases C-terminal domain-containing protein n=1 Tax=Pilimelia terevasa TaxID=53372 RepID=A0A8J3FJY1_9ACTN|nr:HNH endonuclease family protein [Pilimelia terevasa]GGK43822.1 hypothetical protein GCM10010124_40830 [Pilimelia terevasa]